MILTMIALLLLQAATIPEPSPAAPAVPHKMVHPSKSNLAAPSVKKNQYPCKVEGVGFIHVHEKGGYSTFYDTFPAPPASELAKLKIIPNCVDATERDGK